MKIKECFIYFSIIHSKNDSNFVVSEFVECSELSHIAENKVQISVLSRKRHHYLWEWGKMRNIVVQSKSEFINIYI